MLHRRQLLTGLIAAPLVAAAGSLMPLRGAVMRAPLVIYPFTLSWWERLAGKPGMWRQNARRFAAPQVAPCIEVNPCIDTDCVAGVQVDAGAAWIGDEYFAPPLVSAMWREGPKMLDRGEALWGGSSEISLSKEEERALLGWTGKEQPDCIYREPSGRLMRQFGELVAYM